MHDTRSSGFPWGFRDRDPSRQRPPQDRDPPGQRPPTVNRITDRCTRMHSSGMRTARLLTVSQHALHRGVPAGGTFPGGCTCQGGVPAWGRGVPAWGVYAPCEQNDWQTGVKTEPSQTTFAGGKKHYLPATSFAGGKGYGLKTLSINRRSGSQKTVRYHK